MDEVEVRALTQVLSDQTGKTVSLWSWLCVRRFCHVETGKGRTQTIATKLEAIYYCLKYLLYAAALRFPFIGTERPEANDEKQPQTRSTQEVSTCLWPYSVF